MRYLLVDDDEDFSRRLMMRLDREIPVLHDRGDLVLTEKALLEKLKEPAFAYRFVILDVMVRWTAFNDETVTEEPAERGGYFRAGLRCLLEIRRLDAGKEIPILIYSAVDPLDVKGYLLEHSADLEYVEILRKGRDIEKLVNSLRAMVRPDGS